MEEVVVWWIPPHLLFDYIEWLCLSDNQVAICLRDRKSVV